MKTTLLVALAALSVAGCATAVDGEGSQADGTLSASESDVALGVPTAFLVDFDHDPSGNPIADGTIVDSVYSAWGVTFSGILCMPACTTGHAYARTDTTGNNVVTMIPPGLTPPAHYEIEFNALNGGVRADFTNPRIWASIDAVPIVPGEPVVSPSDTQRPWFEAYDATNHFLPPTIYYPFTFSGSTGPGWGSPQALKVNAGTSNIKWVRFSVVPQSGMAWPVWGMFDNLRFNGVTLNHFCSKITGC
jgi:hypothetical protein